MFPWYTSSIFHHIPVFSVSPSGPSRNFVTSASWHCKHVSQNSQVSSSITKGGTSELFSLCNAGRCSMHDERKDAKDSERETCMKWHKWHTKEFLDLFSTWMKRLVIIPPPRSTVQFGEQRRAKHSARSNAKALRQLNTGYSKCAVPAFSCLKLQFSARLSIAWCAAAKWFKLILYQWHSKCIQMIPNAWCNKMIQVDTSWYKLIQVDTSISKWAWIDGLGGLILS